MAQSITMKFSTNTGLRKTELIDWDAAAPTTTSLIWRVKFHNQLKLILHIKMKLVNQVISCLRPSPDRILVVDSYLYHCVLLHLNV